MRRHLSRRTLLLGAGALTLAACTRTEPEDTTGPSPSVRTATPEPTPEAELLPDVTAWQPGPNEVQPEAKIAAVRCVEALGNVDSMSPITSERLSEIGVDPSLADRVGDLVIPAVPAATQIVYPQYGGLTPTAVSVMVVADQFWLHPDSQQVEQRTITADIRLAANAGQWAVTDIRPVPYNDLDSQAATGPAWELLDHSDVRLPNAAQSDLIAGIIAPEVAQILLALAATYRIDVTAFSAGHPEEVFGTKRTSNHTRGRAVDVWAVNDVPVIDMSPDDPLLQEFLTAARDLGSDEIGGPTDPDGPGGVHFTDALHRDHVHIGFDP